MLSCQRDLFHLEPGDGFLNGSYLSPQLKSVYSAGRHALGLKNNPMSTRAEDFFTPVDELKRTYAELVNCPDPERIALIPAVSYGMATVAKNLRLDAHQNIVIAGGQFPSNYYSWAEKCREAGAELRIVERPNTQGDVTAAWNEAVFNAIDEHTALLAIAHIHWADGTLWDLLNLRRKTREVGAWLAIDGTQSVGALPFSVSEIEPDALICAGYKWLMGPYGCGYAYYGPALDNGQPLEENWINRHNSEDFRQLVNYQDSYRPKAGRYSVGEHSNFVFLPMQQVALRQLLAWRPERIQEYCGALWSGIEDDLAELGIQLPNHRAQHLVGIRLPEQLDASALPAALAKRKLALSFRGDAIRVSPNVYNRVDEMGRLLDALRSTRRRVIAMGSHESERSDSV